MQLCIELTAERAYGGCADLVSTNLLGDLGHLARETALNVHPGERLNEGLPRKWVMNQKKPPRRTAFTTLTNSKISGEIFCGQGTCRYLQHPSDQS